MEISINSYYYESDPSKTDNPKMTHAINTSRKGQVSDLEMVEMVDEHIKTLSTFKDLKFLGMRHIYGADEDRRNYITIVLLARGLQLKS